MVSRTTLSRPARIGGAIAAALAVGALAACTSSSGSPSTPPSSPTTPPNSTVTVTASGAPPSSPSSSVPSSPSSSDPGNSGGNGGSTTLSDCVESQLRASLDPRPVSGSSTRSDLAIIVDFQNTSNRSCRIVGYPGAALENSSGKQVTQATRTIRGKLLGLPVGHNSLPVVTLKPGAYASAGIEGVNQQETGAAQAGCDGTFYPRILITPPNTRTPVPFAHRWPVCFSFDVHPTNIEKNPPA